MYYVYRYIRLDRNTPFYVGKGMGRRAIDLKKRNRYFKNIIASIPYKMEIVEEGLSEQQAFLKEKELIGLYKSLGYCEANMSLGGERGPVGHSPSPETRAKISNGLKGKKRKITEEHRRHIVEANKAKKGIRPKNLSQLVKTNTGAKRSEETRRRMSEAKKKQSPETRQKISLARRAYLARRANLIYEGNP